MALHARSPLTRAASDAVATPTRRARRRSSPRLPLPKSGPTRCADTAAARAARACHRLTNNSATVTARPPGPGWPWDNVIHDLGICISEFVGLWGWDLARERRGCDHAEHGAEGEPQEGLQASRRGCGEPTRECACGAQAGGRAGGGGRRRAREGALVRWCVREFAHALWPRSAHRAPSRTRKAATRRDTSTPRPRSCPLRPQQHPRRPRAVIRTTWCARYFLGRSTRRHGPWRAAARCGAEPRVWIPRAL